MAQKISENTEVQLDLKNNWNASGRCRKFSCYVLYFAKDIDLAKELPKPEVSRTEYDLKDELVRSTIMDIDEKFKTIVKS